MNKILFIYASILISLFITCVTSAYADNKEVTYDPVTKNLEYTAKNVTKATSTTKYKAIGFTVKYNSKTATVRLDSFSDVDLGNGYLDVPFVVPARKGSGSVLERLRKAGVPDDQLIDLFSEDNTLYLDAIMTITENGHDLATMNSDGSFTSNKGGAAKLNSEYFTDPSVLMGIRSWKVPSDIENKFFGLHCYLKGSSIDDTVLKNSLANPVAHISKGGTTVDNDTISYLDNEEISLSGINSSFPAYADGKFYKWEYKPTASSTWTTIANGEGKVTPSFPKLTIGNYNVRLTVWYRVGNTIYPNKSSTAQVILNITQSPQGAYVTAEPSTDGDKMVTQSQINSNATINVTVTVKGTLKNYSDTSKITQWKNNLRKDPSGTGDQFQAFTYTSGLGLSQTSKKTFTLQAGVLKSADSYTQKFAVSSFATVNGQLLKSNTEYCAVTLYKGMTPPPQTNNKPPVAVISAPSTAKLGEDVFITGAASYDPDGTVERYLWGIAGPNVTPETSYTTVTYPKTGNFNIFLAVYDNDGAQGAAQQTITIVPPTPEAHFTVAGTQKEMRIITLTDTSTSPARYPITTTKNVWIVSPVSGSGAVANAIYIVTNKSTVKEQVTGDLYSASSLNGLNAPMITFTKAGQYDITLTVTNAAGYSNSTTQRITVQPDLPPVSKFTTDTKIYRETIVNGVNYAKITVNDESYSPDGDFISYRKIWAVYDANNNGIFGDVGDQTIVISETSDRNVIDTVKAYEYLTRDVGKYDVHVTVKESYIP